MIVSIIAFAGCNKLQDNTTQEMPKDFNFILTYGTYGKQKIDTFNNIIIKDLVVDGVVEADISLTEDEMRQIYNEMLKLGMMGELVLDKEKECGVDPPSFSTWYIEMNGQMKSVVYADYCEYPEDVMKLKELEHFIHHVVSIKEEYRELPHARGGYD
jgi:hypothetical protein